MVYSPLDALRIARKNPDREVIFFGLGFETTMPSTAMTVLQAHAQASRISRCSAITSPSFRPSRRFSIRPDLHLDGFLGPGHVSMVIGTGLYEFIARHYRKPITVAGFEPLDVLQSLWMVLKQIAEGRCEVENQYGRIVPADGNRAGAGGDRGSLRVARIFRMAWAGLDRSFRRAAARGLCGFDAERKFAVPNVRIADPKACQCGEVLKGVIKPQQCKVFGTACTPETPLGSLDGLERGRVRGAITVMAGVERAGVAGA